MARVSPSLLPVFLLLPLAPARAEDPVRLNQIQVIGSHNSYHVSPHPNVLGLLGAKGRERSNALEYTHRPLAEQFSNLGIRQIELDVYADPAGGLYARPTARKLLQTVGKEPGPDPDADGVLRKPGLKVFHIQDIDYLSTAPTFLGALRQVRDWSRAHPDHVPIVVLVELKDEAIPALPTRPIPFDRAGLDAVDAEIRSVFGADEIVTPDLVRGDSETLRGALRSRGWPTLDSVRGRVLFALDNEGETRDLYLADHPSLRGRAMFAAVEPDQAAAAWMKVNDPVADFDRIRELVRAGFLVRTRADADTAEARRNDPGRREKALASGAQFVSTDYPEARLDLSPYRVRLPGDVVARPNPVSGPPGLNGVDWKRGRRSLEDLGIIRPMPRAARRPPSTLRSIVVT